MHPVDFLYQRVTHIVRPFYSEYAEGEVDACGHVCSDCGRPAEVAGDRAFLMKQYGRTTAKCQSCFSLYAGSVDLIGVESRRSPTSVCSAKFGMMVGIGVLIEPHRVRFFGGKNLFADSEGGNKAGFSSRFPYERVNLTSALMQRHLAREELVFPLLYISNFGKAKDRLVGNLRISLSKDALYRCSDKDQEVIDLDLFRPIKEAFDNLDESRRNRWLFDSIDFAKGTFSLAAMKAKLNANEDEAALAELLPIDPHQRITLLEMLKPTKEIK